MMIYVYACMCMRAHEVTDTNKVRNRGLRVHTHTQTAQHIAILARIRVAGMNVHTKQNESGPLAWQSLTVDGCDAHVTRKNAHSQI